MDADTVASGIDKAHEEMSILQYNDENSLSCTVNLAFYFAREYYTMIRELPSGKGFADICMIPRKTHLDKPAVVIELKWDKSASIAHNASNNFLDDSTESATPCQFIVLIAFTYSCETSLFGIAAVSLILS